MIIIISQSHRNVERKVCTRWYSKDVSIDEVTVDVPAGQKQIVRTRNCLQYARVRTGVKN